MTEHEFKFLLFDILRASSMDDNKLTGITFAGDTLTLKFESGEEFRIDAAKIRNADPEDVIELGRMVEVEL